MSEPWLSRAVVRIEAIVAVNVETSTKLMNIQNDRNDPSLKRLRGDIAVADGCHGHGGPPQGCPKPSGTPAAAAEMSRVGPAFAKPDQSGYDGHDRQQPDGNPENCEPEI